jgi:hypothetical protein
MLKMVEGITSPRQYIYHYTPWAKVILTSRTLKFGMYTNTNDPKEAKDWHFDIGTNEKVDVGLYDMTALAAWLTHEVKASTRLACFSLDTPPSTGNHINDIFNRGFCKPRMWAQYAARRTGACLVFDFTRLQRLVDSHFSPRGLLLGGPMQYLDRSVIMSLQDKAPFTINLDFLERLGNEEYARAHLLTNYKRFYFEKMEDWSNECEYRWVVLEKGTSGDLFLKFEDSLVGIMFGEDTDDSEIGEIKEMTSDMNLEYMGLKWRNCSPWYDYRNPRYYIYAAC